MAQVLRKDTQVVVHIGPFVDVTDAVTPETGITLSGADEAELLKGGATTTTDISGATWAAISSIDGWYNLTLTTSHTDTTGTLDVIVHDDSVCLPVFARFQVVEEVVFDAIYAASAQLHTSQISDIESSLVIALSDIVVIDDFVDTEIAALTSNLVIVASDTVAIEIDTSTTLEARLSDVESSLVIIKSDTVILTSNSVVISSDTAVIEAAGGSLSAAQDSKLTQIRSDLIIAASDIVVVASDTVVIESDTTAIEAAGGSLTAAQSSKLTQIESDLIIVGSDVVVLDSAISDVESSLVIARSDLVVATSNHVIISSDVAVIEAAISDVESSLVIAKSDLVVVEAGALSSDAVERLTRAGETEVLGTCDAGSSTSSVIASSLAPASVADDQFNNRTMIFAGDTTTTELRGQATDISDYDHGSLAFTVTELTTAPSSGDSFIIV